MKLASSTSINRNVMEEGTVKNDYNLEIAELISDIIAAAIEEPTGIKPSE